MSSSKCVSEEPEERSSSFAQTCNLLSRYVKEKGSLRNLNIEIGGKVESLETIVKPGSSFSASSSIMMNLQRNDKAKSAQWISAAGQASMPNSTIVLEEEDATNKNSTSKRKAIGEQKLSQLTIFYSGKVLVFEDYPMEKVRKVVSFAKKNSSQMSYGILSNTCKEQGDLITKTAAASTSSSGKQPAVISSSTCKEKTNYTDRGIAASCSKAVQEQLSLQSDANDTDLPIARRSSIHRFLEKRKDRASGRMPYHHNQDQPGSSSSKGDGELDLNF